MLSKTKIAYIRSLHDKSTRFEEGIFLVEGRKCVLEYIDSDFDIIEGFFVDPHSCKYSFPCETISHSELLRISTLMTNDFGLLLVRMRPFVVPKIKTHELVLVLDRISDPGNLGTIIRIADWYGVGHIICSLDTVDCYNPKTIMATMGSFARVSLFYTDLEEYFLDLLEKGTLPHIYGAYLNGESIHTKNWPSGGGYLVIGNEAHGISDTLEKYITDKITIPRFGNAESLNAGIATAVILDRMRE